MEMVPYLRGIGLLVESEGQGWKLKKCPLCGHRDCFKISQAGFFKCFSCNSGGDAIKFDSLRSGITYQEAKARLTGSVILSLPDAERSRVERNHARLLGSDKYLMWLTSHRHIALDIIQQFKIGCFDGHDGKIHYSFPYYDGLSVTNVKYRTEDKTIYFKKGGSEFLFNRNVLGSSDIVIVVEGEMDCLAAYSYRLKYPTVSVGLGAGSHKRKWHDDFASVSKVYIAFDNDAPGRNGAIKLAGIIGSDKCRIVRLPLKDMNDCLIHGIDKSDIEACIHKSLSVQQIKIFDSIDSIQLDEPVLGEKLSPILELIAERPLAEIEDYIRAIRSRFPEISYRQALDFRNRVKTIQFLKRQEVEPSAPQLPSVPESVEHEAIALLKSKTLFEKIGETLTEAGIVGEDYNKICLWLFFLSRKLERPINCVVFGQSSSGKSEMVKKVLSTVPEEDVLEFTSMSARALDYATETCWEKSFSLPKLTVQMRSSMPFALQ